MNPREQVNACVKGSLLKCLNGRERIPYTREGLEMISSVVQQDLKCAGLWDLCAVPPIETWEFTRGNLYLPPIEMKVTPMTATIAPATYTGLLLCGLNPFANAYATKNGQRWRCTRVEHTSDGVKFHGSYESRPAAVSPVDPATLRPWKDALPFDLELGKTYVLSDGSHETAHLTRATGRFVLGGRDFHPRGNAVFGHNNLTVLGEYFPRGLELGAEYEFICNGELGRGVAYSVEANGLDSISVGPWWFVKKDGTNGGRGYDRRVLRKIKDAPAVAPQASYFEEGAKYTIRYEGKEIICTASRRDNDPDFPWLLKSDAHFQFIFNGAGEHCASLPPRPPKYVEPAPFFEEGAKYTITLSDGRQEIVTATLLTPSPMFPRHPWCLSNAGYVRKFFNDKGEHCLGDISDVKKYVEPPVSTPNAESALQSKCRKQAVEITRLQGELEKARTPRPADPRVGRLQKDLEAAQQATSAAVQRGLEDVRTLKRHTDRLEAKLASAEILCRAFELHPEHSPEVRAHRVRCRSFDGAK